MLGWFIVISRQMPEEWTIAPYAESSATLAAWETGISGNEWIVQLKKAGRAKQITLGGYPDLYSARAGDVLPLIQNGPPAHNGPLVIGDDYVKPGNWNGDFELHEDRVAACEPDQILTVELWDLS